MDNASYKREVKGILRDMIHGNRAAVKAAELALFFNELDPEQLKKINYSMKEASNYIKKIREQKLEMCSVLTEKQREIVEESLYDMNRGLVLVVKKIYPEALQN